MKTLFSSRINFKLLRYSIAKNKMFIAIFSVLLISLLPVPIIMRIVSRGTDYTDATLIPFMGFFIPTTMILFGCIPFLFFNYLFKTPSVDTYHSLPIKRSDLFITLSCASFLFALLPFTLSYWSGYFIGYCTNLVPMASGHFTMFVRLLVLFSSLTAISVLVIMNTGTLSDALIYTGILSLLPFLAFIALNFFSLKYIFGFSSGITEFLILTSPHFAILELLTRLEGFYAPNIIASFWLLITIILTALSICIYKKRQSERSGHPFTNNFFFPSIASVFTGILLITLVSVWSSLDYSYQSLSIFNIRVLLIPVLISLVVYILLSIIKNRSTKNITRTIKQFGLIAIGTLLICFAFIQTGGFGYETKLPYKNSIKSVTINNVQALSPLANNNYQLELVNPENIDAIYAFHDQIINEYRNDATLVKEFIDYDYSNFVDFKISYKMENGSTLSRTYWINYSLISEIESVLFSEEVVHSTEFFNSKYKIDSLSVYNATFTEAFDFNGNIETLRSKYMIDTAGYTADDWVRNGTEVQYILYFTTEYSIQQQIIVDSRMTNTIAYLQEYSGLKTTTPDFSYVIYDGEKAEALKFYDAFHGYVLGVNRYPRFSAENVLSYPIEQNEAAAYTPYIIAYGYNDAANDVLNVSGQDQNGNYIDFWLPIRQGD